MSQGRNVGGRQEAEERSGEWQGDGAERFIEQRALDAAEYFAAQADARSQERTREKSACFARSRKTIRMQKAGMTI